MAEQPQSRDTQAEATSAPQIRPNETTSKRTAWRPLRLTIFRNLLIADLLSDIGTFMQGVGAAWLMVSQGAGPLLVALIQTASALPFFLLALPAGALGDIFDRRKVISATEVWMLSIATALAVLTVCMGYTVADFAVARCIPTMLRSATVGLSMVMEGSQTVRF